jgi:hypothetical protein
MKAALCFGLVLAFNMTAAPASAAGTGDQSPPTTSIGAIISGLGGIVTATQAPLANNYLAAGRIMMFRNQLQAWLVNPRAATDINPFKANPVPDFVLCSTRGDYALLAAKAAYLSGVDTALAKFQPPSTKSTIGELILDLFKNYSIAAPTKLDSSTASKVKQACEDDLNGNWPQSYYKTPGAPLNALVAGVPGVDPISDLQTLVAIITPLLQFVDDYKRDQAIIKYLQDHKKDLMTVAGDLVASEIKLANTTKQQSLGQFADSMAAIRTLVIDTSKIDDCGTAALTFPTDGKDALDPSKKFLDCYAEVWQRASKPVQAAVTAAAQYDGLADTVPKDAQSLQDSLKKISDTIDKLNQPQQIDLQTLLNDVGSLISYAEQIQQAVAPGKAGKIETDINSIMKQFGISKS